MLPGVNLVFRGDFPHPNGTVSSGGKETFSVGRTLQHLDIPGKFYLIGLVPRLGVVKEDASPVIARHERFPIRRPRDSPHTALGRDDKFRLARFCLPHADFAAFVRVPTAVRRDQPFAVGRESRKPDESHRFSSFLNFLIVGGKRPGSEGQGRDCERDPETDREHFGQHEISFPGEQTRLRLSHHACFVPRSTLRQRACYLKTWLLKVKRLAASWCQVQ